MSDAPILFELGEAHVALVRFNRPAARNAIDVATAKALDAIVQATEARGDVRAVVLASSTPGLFSAGADLKDVAAGRAAALIRGDAGFAGLADARRSKPWIAAVDGPALGGGCELCLACDMIVASPESRFGLPEVRLGLMAGAGGVHRIARVLPRNIALELVAGGVPLDAAAAARHGMVNRLVPGADVIAEAVALARLIAANAPRAVVESLAVARAAGDVPDAALRRLSREALDRVMQSPDAAEGPRAFVERRPPRWRDD